ncbi:DUF6497 family protein [Phaeobacter sp.]|uniref:DUF6497 family protein n=1 Tax=Phaeobacter sp. TaxID=1902409 RepID=UPI0025D8DA02|nr:DUF6497 family protein [Phaeobacter sp.]
MIRVSSFQKARTTCAAPAAPAGGAHAFWGRGCGNEHRRPSGTFVAFALATALSVALIGSPSRAASDGAAKGFTLQSGLSVSLHEVLLDERAGAQWARFRFLAPDIAQDPDADQDPDTEEGSAAALSYEDITADFDHLCASLVLAYLKQRQLQPAKVILSLSDRVVPFGKADPTATQYFESYRPEGDSCVWEAF